MKGFIQDIIIVIAIFIVGLIIGLGIRINVLDNKDSDKVVFKQNTTDSVNIKYVNSLLNKHKIKFSRIVLAQIALESNHLKHKRVLEDKNITGMKVSAQRYTFAINNHDYGAFAKYETIEECIMDYKSFQIQNALFITTEEQYLEMLSKVYCKDIGYIKQIKRLMK